MKKLLTVLFLSTLTTSFATPLTGKKVAIELDDLTDLPNEQLIRSFEFEQTPETAKNFEIIFKYLTPKRECVKEEPYIVHPDCDKEDSFAIMRGECDPYIAYRCSKYILELSRPERANRELVLKLRFKKTTDKNKKFVIDLTKKHYSNYNQRKDLEMEIMRPQEAISSGQSNEIEFKKPNLFRSNNLYIFK